MGRGRPKQGDQRSELTVASDNITRGYFFPLKLEFFARFGFNWLGKTGFVGPVKWMPTKQTGVVTDQLLQE